jgi:hypothetical protein
LIPISREVSGASSTTRTRAVIDASPQSDPKK